MTHGYRNCVAPKDNKMECVISLAVDFWPWLFIADEWRAHATGYPHFRGTCHGRVPTWFVNTTPSGWIYPVVPGKCQQRAFFIQVEASRSNVNVQTGFISPSACRRDLAKGPTERQPGSFSFCVRRLLPLRFPLARSRVARQKLGAVRPQVQARRSRRIRLTGHQPLP